MHEVLDPRVRYHDLKNEHGGKKIQVSMPILDVDDGEAVFRYIYEDRDDVARMKFWIRAP